MKIGANKIMDPILQFQGKFEFLSNFSYLPILLAWRGVFWSTVEHAFQAEKCLDPQAQKEIRNAETPGIAKKLGRTVKLRDDWEQIKIPVMTELVWLKFEQNPFLQDKLLDTGNAYLIEGNYWHDNFWGECYCDQCAHIAGTNYLGHILMEVREGMRMSVKESEYTPVLVSVPAMELKEAAHLYIEAKKKLTLCMQDHFKQVCHSCKEYSKCSVYSEYVQAWQELQNSYYN